MRGARSIYTNGPGDPGTDPKAQRSFPPGTISRAERLFFDLSPPQHHRPLHHSAFSGGWGPRGTVQYVIPGPVVGRRYRLANTLLALTFRGPRGAVARAGQPALMRPRPRFTRVLRYPRPDREPRVYGE